MKIKPELIEIALGALSRCNIVQDGRYDKEFTGYISSFGAAIIQSGLLPAVIFFEQEESESAKDRKKIINAVKDIVNKSLPENEKIDGKLAKYILNHNKAKDSVFLERVTESAVALKLALRMYKKNK